MKAGFHLLAAFLLLTSLPAAPVLPVSADNSALRLKILSVSAAASYGPLRAPAGRQFVVLATEWENRIDPKLAAERGLATAYMVGDLAQHLYLIMDGRWLGGLRGKLRGADGHVSLESVSLGKPGAKITGDIVYELPTGAWQSLDLRFYDDTTGYLKIALAGEAPVAKPLQVVQKNAIAELGLFALENPAAGVTAPAGFRAVAVELRARSLWQIDGAAPAYDASQPPGAQIQHVNLLDWPETRKYIHVLADGDIACPPQEAGTLPDTARFVPEFLTGGKLVFFVPADAKSLELFCEMPHAAAPGGGVMDLAPLSFPLAGTPPAPNTTPPLVAIQDEMFAIAVTGCRRVGTIAGESAAEGKQFLALAVTVSNQGPTGEFFQPRDQMFILDGNGAETPVDEITAKGPHRPEEQVHLPAGARRRFEVVYQIDRTNQALKLSFHGGNFMQSYDLPATP